jgi:hypothetical protein
LTADPDLQDKRAREFAKFFLADKAFWMHYALRQFAGKKEEREIREYAKQQGIVDDPKLARRHWANLKGSFIWDTSLINHPLDGPAVTPDHKKTSYAADYYQTSAFVHCSLSAIDNYYTEEEVPFHVSPSSDLHNTSQPTLFIILIYLHSSVAYVLFGMNLDNHRPKLNTLFERTLRKMKPVRRRYGRLAKEKKKSRAPRKETQGVI